MPDKNQKKAAKTKQQTKKSGTQGNDDQVDSILDAGSGYTQK
jgi:hypothetical protein